MPNDEPHKGIPPPPYQPSQQSSGGRSLDTSLDEHTPLVRDSPRYQHGNRPAGPRSAGAQIHPVRGNLPEGPSGGSKSGLITERLIVLTFVLAFAILGMLLYYDSLSHGQPHRIPVSSSTHHTRGPTTLPDHDRSRHRTEHPHQTITLTHTTTHIITAEPSIITATVTTTLHSSKSSPSQGQTTSRKRTTSERVEPTSTPLHSTYLPIPEPTITTVPQPGPTIEPAPDPQPTYVPPHVVGRWQEPTKGLCTSYGTSESPRRRDAELNTYCCIRRVFFSFDGSAVVLSLGKRLSRIIHCHRRAVVRNAP
jgi:hypothetical protein